MSERENVAPIPRSEVQSGAYLLHFSEEVPYEKARRYGGKRHYVGASTDIFRRVAEHRLGLGSLMTQKAFELGISMSLVGIFPGAKATYIESIITKSGAESFCPICNEENYLAWKKERRDFKNLPPTAQEKIWAWRKKGKD